MIVTSATSQNWKKNTLAQNLKVFILKVKFHHCVFCLLVENGNKKECFFWFSSHQISEFLFNNLPI
jgi:hypothetical protein